LTVTRLNELAEFGQSVWLDYISRKLIKTGRLMELISQGLLGMTSNPTIFDNAISKSDDYDEDIKKLASQGKSTFEIYDELTIRDIQDAADLFLPIYEKTGGLDGYVSLEINPMLARKTEETIAEGKRLHKKVNRRNLMFKVPATEEGYHAIEELLAAGINVNVTLIFSLEQYEKTAHAYIRGVQRLIEKGGDPSKLRSVASVFVSRIDSAVDRMLEEKMGLEECKAIRGSLQHLLGKAAVANSLLIYDLHGKIFDTPQFHKLREKGAHYQRVLWGSTSSKNPAYSDIKYVEELMVKNSVNTMPENTLLAFLDHGAVKDALSSRSEGASDVVEELDHTGISVDEVCAKLLKEGVTAFEKSFESLLKSIEHKSTSLAVKG
jgi:transaldolase